ncbi:MAG: T9SS type A sorting domain-containing protein [Candidatus Cloacimonetes bacterium]|nr:T9SS type A sorting domain-containing protein [Candidatus Cloacimonadota bacterium]
MKNILVLLMLSLWSICRADPDWEVVIYTNSTVAYCQVTIDDIAGSNGDLLGAFVEAECRGIGEIFVFGNNSYTTLNIQGDIPEQVSFLVWDQSIDIECAVEYTTVTAPGNDIGYPPDYLPIAAYSGNPINHYPEMELPATLIIPEDIPTTFDFDEFCSDIDGDELTITGEASEHIMVSSNGMIVTLTTIQDWVGIEFVTFWLSDGMLSVHDSLEVFVTAVNDPPVITDTYPETGSIEVEQFDPVSFAVMAYDIDSAISFSWYIDGELQTTVDYILNHTFLELGEVEVHCIVSDGSYEVQAQWQVTVNINPVSEETILEQDWFCVYPNPCSDFVHLKWELQRSQPRQICIYDLKGRKLLTIPATSRSGTVLCSEIGRLPAGKYFVSLQTDNATLRSMITIK